MTTAASERTALIVDDEDQIRRLVGRVLERAGIRTLDAESAQEARALFDAHASEIDMMLLDVTMPHGEGAEQLLPEFVARRPGAIAIVTSGDDLPPGLEAELERVRGVFLRKPFVPNELLRLVEEGRAEDSADPTGASRGLA